MDLQGCSHRRWPQEICFSAELLWVGALGEGSSSVSQGLCCLRAAAGLGHNCHCSQEQPWLVWALTTLWLLWFGQMWKCELCTNTSAALSRGYTVTYSPGSATAHASTMAPGLSWPAQRMLPTKISKLPKLQAKACTEVVSFSRWRWLLRCCCDSACSS